MNVQIEKVEVRPLPDPVLLITMTGGATSSVPLSPPVVALLNAGGWLMREYVARTFEVDLGGANLISRRVRAMEAGERPVRQGPAGSSSSRASGAGG